MIRADGAAARISLRRTIVATILTLILGVATIACDAGGESSSAPATSTPPAFPYAPFEIRTDIAVPLDQPLLDAAQFALDMSVDARVKNDPEQTAVYNRYRSRIAPEEDTPDLRAPDRFIGETGGALHRAVAARALPDGDFEISICLYDTPGLYAMNRDGELVPANSPDSLWRPRVLWTSRPAADGSTPPGPRWLLMDEGIDFAATQEEKSAVCDPFKPDPFVQKAPDPTSSPAG